MRVLQKFLALAGMSCLLFAVGCTSSTPHGPSVSGIVTNHDGQKVSGVEVVLRQQGNDRTAPVKDGVFYFDQVQSGSATIFFKPPAKAPYQVAANASAAEKEKAKTLNQMAAGTTGPVTENISGKYLNPATSKLQYEVKEQGVTTVEIQLQK